MTFRREKSMGKCKARLPSIFLPSGAAAYFPFFWSGVPFQKLNTPLPAGNYCVAKKCAQQSHFYFAISFVIFPCKWVPRGLNPTFSLDANLCPFYSPFLLWNILFNILIPFAFSIVFLYFIFCISFYLCPIQLAFHFYEIEFNI